MRSDDKFRPLDVVDAAYAAATDERTWLSNVLTQMRPLMGPGVMLQAFSYRVDDGRCSAREYVVDGMSDVTGFRARLEESLGRFEADLVQRAFTGTRAIGVRELFGGDEYGYTPPPGLSEGAGFTTFDTTHHGIAFVVLSNERRQVTPAELRRWQRVGAHVSAAFRLRRRRDARPAIDDADVLFDARLKVVRVGAGSDAAVPGLTSAAEAVRAAHGKLRSASPDDALELWRALFAGRWSVQEVIDTDGKCFFVGRRNPPGAIAAHALTELERFVVSAAALGHGNKLIGYELGVPVSSVARLLSSAQQKLGLDSRAELVRMFTALSIGRRAATSDDDARSRTLPR